MADPVAGLTRPALLARSPIRQAPPLTVSGGWEVSARRSDAPLRLADASPLAKLLVRPGEGGEPEVPFGRAARIDGGPLVVGSRPAQLTVIGTPEAARAHAGSYGGPVVDLTHGLALLRLTGQAAPEVMASLCAVDLDERVTPNGAAFTSSVAKVVTEVVRDDLAGLRSYLMACDRSYGQYLFDAVSDAGREHGLDIDGFPGWG